MNQLNHIIEDGNFDTIIKRRKIESFASNRSSSSLESRPSSISFNSKYIGQNIPQQNYLQVPGAVPNMQVLQQKGYVYGST